MFPDELHYTRSHEWVRPGEQATIGITHFAQEELGDLVYIDLPQEGRALTAGEGFGTVESVKTVSDVYAPVAGVVTAVNAALTEHPELVNNDPYGEGWLIRLRPESAGDILALLSAEDYQHVIDSGH